MNWKALCVCLVALAPTAFVNHTIFDGFVVLKVAGHPVTFFDTDLPTGNPDFTNTVATASAGESIRIGGATNQPTGFYRVRLSP